MDIISTEEPVKGRLLVVKAQIQGLLVFLINIYAPTVGQERILFLNLLNETLKNVPVKDVLSLVGTGTAL